MPNPTKPLTRMRQKKPRAQARPRCPNPLVLELTEADVAEIEAQSAEDGIEPTELAGILLRRQLYRADGQARRRITRYPHGNPVRAYERGARQLALAQHILEHGAPVGLNEKRALAARFGVDAKTIYRDLKVAQAAADRLAIVRAAEAAEATAEVEAEAADLEAVGT